MAVPLRPENNSIEMKRIALAIITLATMATASAQVEASDSTFNHAGGSRFTVGGYGEAVFSRNFYSDHVSRYSQPEAHKNDPSHGRFDQPLPKS